MEIETLVSTMNVKNEEKFCELLNKMNIQKKCLVINQLTDGTDKLLEVNKDEKRIISFLEKGLSKSRNNAISNSRADIGIFADDDVVYVNNYNEIIKEEYIKNPEYDIIAFYVENAKEKDNLKEGNVDFIHSFKLCSVQITVKIDSIRKKKILFEEKFGTGSNLFNFGEENIFLTDCIRKGLKIYYSPKKIATLSSERNSSWFKGFNEEYFYTRGALFYRISKLFYPLLIVQFAIRKREKYIEHISVKNALVNMFKGVKKYKEVF